MFRGMVLLAVLGLLLFACSPEYEWKKVAPPASIIEWKPVSVEVMFSICNRSPENFPRLGGCSFYIGDGGTCYVYSKFSEFDAHRVMSGDGLTLYEHEVGDRKYPDKPFGHCNGWVHAEPAPRTMGS